MEWIFAPLQPFVWHPERIAVVAVCFFIAYAIVRSIGLNAKPLLLPAIFWTLFVPWEAYCKAGKFNIRVDLFLIIYPVLLVATIAGIVMTVAGMFKAFNQPSADDILKASLRGDDQPRE